MQFAGTGERPQDHWFLPWPFVVGGMRQANSSSFLLVARVNAPTRHVIIAHLPDADADVGRGIRVHRQQLLFCASCECLCDECTLIHTFIWPCMSVCSSAHAFAWFTCLGPAQLVSFLPWQLPTLSIIRWKRAFHTLITPRLSCHAHFQHVPSVFSWTRSRISQMELQSIVSTGSRGFTIYCL